MSKTDKRMNGNKKEEHKEGRVKVCKQCKKVIVGKSHFGLCESCARKTTSRVAAAATSAVVGVGVTIGTVIKNQIKKS